MSYKQSHEYRRRILLVIIGMTPQIVTETLYKLAVQNQPAFIPTEVHLITTNEGANSARLALLGVDERQGWFQQFKDDFKLQDIKFSDKKIHVITDTEGQFINDNQSTEHNRIASDFITEKVKEFTADDESALHVSLAGGRKTMSFYAGYALSLYGRTQDRLSHVLVSEQFQNNKDFFYPRPTPERIEINNRYYNTDEAQIILSDIPFVRMQRHIPRALLDGKEGFQETVEKIARFTGPDTIELNVSEQSVVLNAIPVNMTDFEFTYYLWLCLRKTQGKPMLEFDKANFMPEFLDVYASVVGKHSVKFEKAEETDAYVALKDENGYHRFDYQKKYFGPHRSRLEGKIKDKLGRKFAQPFLVRTVETGNIVGYEIGIAAESILIKQ